jgi:hypothetical protein
VIHHRGDVVALVVPIAEYQQLRQVAEEQRVNEGSDAARAGYLARRGQGTSAISPMNKQAADSACPPGEVPDQLGDPAIH